MIEPGRWQIDWSWRMWTFGVILGPEVWQLHVGPLRVLYDPEAT